jgi:hypothetical protein
MSYRDYDPDKQVPDLANKVIVVTGGSSHDQTTMAL